MGWAGLGPASPARPLAQACGLAGLRNTRELNHACCSLFKWIKIHLNSAMCCLKFTATEWERINLPGLVCLTTKTKLRVISALVRQRLVPSFCLPLLSLLVLETPKVVATPKAVAMVSVTFLCLCSFLLLLSLIAFCLLWFWDEGKWTMVIRLSIVFGSLLFFFCRDEDNGRADLWLSSAFFSFSVCWSVLVMKNRGLWWPLLSNLGLDFCYVCGLRFLCFSSVFLGFFFFLVLFFLSRFSLSFSSVSPSNPLLFFLCVLGFPSLFLQWFSVQFLGFALFCLWFSCLSFSNLSLFVGALLSPFIRPEPVVTAAFNE